MNNNSQILEIIAAFSDKIIAYNNIYSKISGSSKSGLLLSVIVPLAKKNNFEEFYKTDSDFCEELQMSLKELKGAKEKLKKIGVINVIRKGVPAKTFYTVNLNQLAELIKNKK